MATTEDMSMDGRIAAARGTIRMRSYGLFAAIAVSVAYLVYAWFAFGVSDIIARSDPERGVTFARDSVAHKIHVTKDMRGEELTVAVEGQRTTTYPDDAPPAWVARDGEDAEVDLGDGVSAQITGRTVIITLADGEQIEVTAARPALKTTLPASIEKAALAELGDADPATAELGLRQRREAGVSHRVSVGPDGTLLPSWLSLNRKRFDLSIDRDKRIQVTATKIEIHRYYFGWENFWFDFDSPLHDMSAGALWRLAWSDDRLDPARSNAALIFHSFWNNTEWRHGYVFTALFETILMAFLGTAFAAIFGLPLAFLAARNFTPSMVVRFGLRRLFDFLRGIDMLIWSLIFIRAFGLGPLTGALAIAFTDTGSLGKLFSEALENVDNKQIEGVRATGADQIARYRFGVIPQILPVFISQSLYFLESNTRSATVIGALGAGGIGLVLVETINTKVDWENVLWLIILTIFVVIAMDMMSSWLRRRLIEGSPDRV